MGTNTFTTGSSSRLTHRADGFRLRLQPPLMSNVGDYLYHPFEFNREAQSEPGRSIGGHS